MGRWCGLYAPVMLNTFRFLNSIVGCEVALLENARKINVLIVEEHPVTRWGLRHFLETRNNITVVGEASTASEARVAISKLKPDVVILDIILPDGDGIELTKEIALENIRRVMAFSAADTWDRVEKFLQAGGLCFVTKRCPPEEFIQALDAVAQNRKWISPSLRNAKPPSAADRIKHEHSLSPREREVVALVARGLTSRQIADQLCVSLKTVETHRYRIFRELQIKSRAQLVSYAIQNGMLGNYIS